MTRVDLGFDSQHVLAFSLDELRRIRRSEGGSTDGAGMRVEQVKFLILSSCFSLGAAFGLGGRDEMEADKIDLFALAVFGYLQQVENAEKTGFTL